MAISAAVAPVWGAKAHSKLAAARVTNVVRMNFLRLLWVRV
jgi:hypothetical protein